MRRFFRSLALSRHSTACQDAIESGNIALARAHYDKMKALGVSKPRLIALGARLSMLERDSKAARSLLMSAMNRLTEDDDKNSAYVRLYCQYFLSLIDRTGDHEGYRETASRLGADKVYTDTLPFPPDEISL